MKIMISQPMNGKSEMQIRKERRPIIKELEKQGFEVIDTIFTEEPPHDVDEGIYFLAKSIEVMSKVDYVVFMNGWEKARGCRIEQQIAIEYKKNIIFV